MQWNQNIAPFKNTAAYIIVSTKNKLYQTLSTHTNLQLKLRKLGPHGLLPVRRLELYVLVKSECEFNPLVSNLKKGKLPKDLNSTREIATAKRKVI